MFRAAVLFLSIAALFAGRAHAQRDLKSGTTTIYFENDLFTGTDRYYTNGTKISWTSPNLEKFRDESRASFLFPLIDRLPLVNAPGFQRNVSFSLGQNIYTPDDTESSKLVRDDRPYAGWLYLGFGLTRKTVRFRDEFGFTLGVVGPWSFAQDAQRIVHATRGLDFPNGWQHQLDNEVGVVLTYQHTRRFLLLGARSGFGLEVLPYLGGALGNVYTHAALGSELRVGLNLPDDFGTPTIGPSDSTPSPVEGAQQERRSKFDIGLYLFARAEGRLIARNIFLDGNTFSDSHSVDKVPVVADLSVGTSINYKNSKLTYAVVYRTEEYTRQNGPQVFGSVTLNFAF